MLRSCIVFRPLGFLIFLMVVVLSLAGVLIPFGINRAKRIENEARWISLNINQELHSGVQRTAKLIAPYNASATNLASALSSSLKIDDLHQFTKIESKVSPALFQALTTIPYVSEISYIGLDGLFFTYYTKDYQLFALYSNSTFPNQAWYAQSANRENGKLYSEAIPCSPYTTVNSSWFQNALNSTNGYASVGTGWANTQETMLLNSANLNASGVISLTFQMTPLINFLSARISSYGGSLYLATIDGNVISDGIPNTHIIFADNKVLVQLLGSNDGQMGGIGNITCQSEDSTLRYSVFSVQGKKYVFSCSPVEIAGVQMVYVLAQPHNELASFIHKSIRIAFMLLFVMVTAMVITLCTFMYLILGATRRHMHLCGSLIKQMEATQQAERKSMNKSHAFASANHDVRASLAGITGLIGICQDEVSRRDQTRSELHTYLQQMEDCAKDLLGILNSVLDMTKIEAGKMQLEEKAFDVEKLLEDVVDLFHPVGADKGVDVILDPCNGSVNKLSGVKGDRVRLKQILCNLLSNAIKFTSEGHVSVRAWARKPAIASESPVSTCKSLIVCLFWKVDKALTESKVVNTIQRDPNCMELVFEVNDTGKGIPNEMRKSVFENYVQVRETAAGQQGTGLGLGIVQSLVRLMGGEIGIVDKEVGERGTCFRLNVFLSTCGTHNSPNEANVDHISRDAFHHSLPITRNNSPKTELSHVVLFIKSTKRSNVLQSYMEKLGIKVVIVNEQEQLSPTLKKIKRKLRNLSSHNSSGDKSDVNLKSDRCILCSASDSILHSQIRPSPRSHPVGFVLIVLDTRASPFRELSRAVAEFRRDLDSNCCSRVIWLDNPGASLSNFKGLDGDKLPDLDMVISKPFHGSRLYMVIRLLPEFRTTTSPRKVERNATDVRLDEASTSKAPLSKRNEIEEIEEPASSTKPLTGKKILVADDTASTRMIASSLLKKLGANIFPCPNGEEAWKLVCKSLDDGTFFDCILMDCQMPIMDGFEATRRIREEEGKYGCHIPIIALTAHQKGGEEMDMMIQAGADLCLSKPLNTEKFLEAAMQLTIIRSN